MRTSNVLLSVALIASVASAAWLWTELDAERTRSAALSARLERQPAEAQRVAATVMAPAAVPVSTSTSATAPTPSAPAAANEEKPRMTEVRAEDWRARQRQLMSDPKYREARREQQRLSLAPRRANLMKLYGFTAEQADAAIDLGIEYEMQWTDVNMLGSSSAEQQQEQQARLKALERDHQDKLRALLGEQKQTQLKNYMESRQSRMQVDSLRTELDDVNALRDDQVEPLIAALHAERSRMQEEMQEYQGSLNWEGDSTETQRRFGEHQAELMKSMVSRMHTSASGILSGGQLDALDAMLNREIARFEAQQRMNRIQTKFDRANRPATAPN